LLNRISRFGAVLKMRRAAMLRAVRAEADDGDDE